MIYLGFSRLHIWRKLRDSNSRRARTLAGFQDRCIQPLCQASKLWWLLYTSEITMQAFFYVNAKNISKRKLNRKLDNYAEHLSLTSGLNTWTSYLALMLSKILKRKTLKNSPILRLKILIQRIVSVPPCNPLQLNNNVENYLADTLSHC